MLVPGTAIILVIFTTHFSAGDHCTWPCDEGYYCDMILFDCLPCSDICRPSLIQVTLDCHINCPDFHQMLVERTTQRASTLPIPSSSLSSSSSSISVYLPNDAVNHVDIDHTEPTTADSYYPFSSTGEIGGYVIISLFLFSMFVSFGCSLRVIKVTRHCWKAEHEKKAKTLSLPSDMNAPDGKLDGIAVENNHLLGLQNSEEDIDRDGIQVDTAQSLSGDRSEDLSVGITSKQDQQQQEAVVNGISREIINDMYEQGQISLITGSGEISSQTCRPDLPDSVRMSCVKPETVKHHVPSQCKGTHKLCSPNGNLVEIETLDIGGKCASVEQASEVSTEHHKSSNLEFATSFNKHESNEPDENTKQESIAGNRIRLNDEYSKVDMPSKQRGPLEGNMSYTELEPLHSTVNEYGMSDPKCPITDLGKASSKEDEVSQITSCYTKTGAAVNDLCFLHAQKDENNNDHLTVPITCKGASELATDTLDRRKLKVEELDFQSQSGTMSEELLASAEHNNSTQNLSSDSMSSGFSLNISACSESPVLRRANFNAHQSSNVQDSVLGPLLDNWHYYSEFDLREDPPPMNAAYNGRWTPPSNVNPVPRRIENTFPPHLEGRRNLSSNELSNGPEQPEGTETFLYESMGGTKYKIVSTASMRALADERMHYFHILDRMDYVAYYISGREGIRVVIYANTKSVEEAKKEFVRRGIKESLLEVTVMDRGKPEIKQQAEAPEEQYLKPTCQISQSLSGGRQHNEEQGAACEDHLAEDPETKGHVIKPTVFTQMQCKNQMDCGNGCFHDFVDGGFQIKKSNNFESLSSNIGLNIGGNTCNNVTEGQAPYESPHRLDAESRHEPLEEGGTRWSIAREPSVVVSMEPRSTVVDISNIDYFEEVI